MKRKPIIDLLKRVSSQNHHAAVSKNNAGLMETRQYKRHPKHKKGCSDANSGKED